MINPFNLIVCLTLDKRVQDGCIGRISFAFHKFGWKVNFFICGDGKTLTKYSYDRVDTTPPKGRVGYPAFVTRPNSWNAFACFKQIIEQAKKDQIETLLLLEDDVELTDNFSETLSLAQSQINENLVDWDMLYLGANHTWARTKQVSENLLKVNGSGCFHAVGLRSTVYDAILDLPMTRPIDGLVGEKLHKRFNCYAVWPNIALQQSGYSYCEGNTTNYGHFWGNKGRV